MTLVIFVVFFPCEHIVPPKKIQVQNHFSTWAQLFYSWALSQVDVVKQYDFTNWYYSGSWYPPYDTWVCSDVIWRAFKDNGIDFKKLLDEDMILNPSLYPNKFDSNINFRRVKNIDAFLKRKSKVLTNEMISGNAENLWKWQAGDIVIFDDIFPKRLWHIWIITDLRREDGVPYMIDNHWYGVKISITPLDWPTEIVGHYRYF